MIRLLLVSLSAIFALSLVACSEKKQSATGSTVKSDGKPWQGAKNDFVVGGWTPGDKESWQKQIRARGQNQNEYVRMN
ncbi:MAG: hypothetical protein ACOH2K_04300 [Burkholderiaceae bacterium]